MMKQNDIIHGFLVQSCREVKELNARFCQLEHEKTGARLCWLDRDDENKTFGIAFCTHPFDDTGVFHIIEHSVLCGSERYPVKEPFVELMKGSQQTFLNAMTFPDKTFYPVASRNEKDFMNLIRVYLDAVLHPLIVSRPEIFCQEGWHYELKECEDTPAYNGVVFNEMKGAFSSPNTLLRREMNRGLFPDTCYRHVSGGDPAHIPDLSYEKFIECYRRYYHPSNAYILLDGRMDVEAVLALLDQEYLNIYDRREREKMIPPQKSVKGAKLQTYYESSPGEKLKGRARLACGYVIGDFRCRKELIAVRVLSDVLCGGNHAPLKRCILSSGLAQNISIGIVDGIQQPYAVLEIRNMDEEKSDEVQRIVQDELSSLVKTGLDHKQLTAALANLEFQMRERDYGSMPRGVVLMMNVLESWLYGGDPAANLEVGELFASLNQQIEENYFEQLLEKVFLNNSHTCQVLMLPSYNVGNERKARETERLRAAEQNWSSKERKEILRQQERLRAWQKMEDGPEQLAVLPTLKLSDIPKFPTKVPTEIAELDTPQNISLLYHMLDTGGVTYVNLYFNVNDITQDKLPILAFLCAMTGNLDTMHHSAMDLQCLGRLNMGDLRLSVEAYSKPNHPEECCIYLCVSYSTLDSKAELATALVTELLTKTRFDDYQKIFHLLRQICANMEQYLLADSSSIALTRVSAGFSAEGCVREYTGGFTYYQWLKELEKNFEKRAEALCNEFELLSKKIFTRGRLTVSVTSGETHSEQAIEKVLFQRLADSSGLESISVIRPRGRRSEGIVIPSSVSNTVLGGNLLPFGSCYSGETIVLSRILSLSYLWNTIRVQGGAYGAGLSLGSTGNACFYSYRDPNAVHSLASYRNISDFTISFADTKPDMTGFIIGAVAEDDPLMLPRRQGRVADRWHLCGITYEKRCRIREEMLSIKPEHMRAFAEPLRKLIADGGICIIGSREQIKNCETELDEIYFWEHP